MGNKMQNGLKVNVIVSSCYQSFENLTMTFKVNGQGDGDCRCVRIIKLLKNYHVSNTNVCVMTYIDKIQKIL